MNGMISNDILKLEQEILGTMLNRNKVIYECRDNIKPQMFSLNYHRVIYKTILEILDKDEFESVDSLILINYAKRKTIKMGGITYITEIGALDCSTANLEAKLKLLAEEYRKREIYSLLEDVKEKETTKEMMECIKEKLDSLYSSNIVREIDIEKEYEDYLNELFNSKKSEGFETGFTKLDNTLGNLQRGRLITVFARSGVGKSTFAIQMALNLAMKKTRVFYASGEMSRQEVYNKITASALDMNYEKLNRKIITQEEQIKVSQFNNILMESKLHVSNETKIDKLINEILQYKLRYGVDVVFIDYVNKYIGSSNKNLTEKIGEITSELKNLALKENICVVMLAQANRKVDYGNKESDITDKITVADIQDSARIEQDSDQVLALYRNVALDNKYTRNQLREAGKLDMNSRIADKNPWCINITVQKNRHGGKDMMALKWDGAKSKVSDWN